MKKAAFFDRDGVINIDHAYVGKYEDFEWIPGILEAAARLHAAGYEIVIVTNQSGIGRGYYTEEDFAKLTAAVEAEFKKAGAPVARTYFCPHHPEAKLERYRCACSCRKPAPGMFEAAVAELGLDASQSIMFGDKRGDMQAALAAGVATRILVGKDAREVPAAVPESTATAKSVADALSGLRL